MKSFWGILAVLLTVVVAGCAPRSMSGDVYSRERAQRVQTIEYGEVLEVRPILIEGTKSGLGALGGGVLGGAVPTVNEPRICTECGSHWYRYVPSVTVTVQDSLPIPPTEVSRSTPGPKRWKLCSSDSSSTSIS